MNHSDPLQNLRGFASQEILEFLRQILLFFPDEFRFRLKQVVEALPREGDNMQKVLELVRSQWKDIQSEEWVHIAVVGPAQTGKTSLLKAMGRKQSESVAPIFGIVETPGLEEFLGYESTQAWPQRLREAGMLLLVLDGRYGVSEATSQMFDRLQSLDKPILVLLNKMDVVENPADAVRQARKRLQNRVFATSAFQPASIDRFLNAIVSLYPKALYPLTRAFPEFIRTI